MNTLRTVLGVFMLLVSPRLFAADRSHEELRDVADFDGVVLQAPLSVRVVVGPKSVRVSGNADLSGWVRTEVVDGTLVVRLTQEASAETLKALQLTVSSPKLTPVESTDHASVDLRLSSVDSFVLMARGASRLFVSSLTAHRLVVDVQDRSEVKLEGSVGALLLNVGESSRVMGPKLMLDSLTAHITTGSRVALNPSALVEASLSGDSRLFVDSKPARCSVSYSDGALILLTCGIYDDPPRRIPPEPLPPEPEQVLESTTSKKSCLEACSAGGEALENFCRGLRSPRRRALCWAATRGSKVACIGMCNALYK